jgi:hypothetical protein
LSAGRKLTPKRSARTPQNITLRYELESDKQFAQTLFFLALQIQGDIQLLARYQPKLNQLKTHRKSAAH